MLAKGYQSALVNWTFWNRQYVESGNYSTKPFKLHTVENKYNDKTNTNNTVINSLIKKLVFVT